MPKFRDIPQFIRANYHINVSWRHLEEHLKSWNDRLTWIDMDPDFQRAHVWTEAQQIAYLEYRMMKGPSGAEIQWNCTEWDRFKKPAPIQLVDGKQRLTAVLRFLHDEIPAFGHKKSEYEDQMSFGTGPDFIFFVNNLQTRAEVLTWYLQINNGGVIHTEEEISKVQSMLEREKQVAGSIEVLYGDSPYKDLESVRESVQKPRKAKRR